MAVGFCLRRQRLHLFFFERPVFTGGVVSVGFDDKAGGGSSEVLNNRSLTSRHASLNWSTLTNRKTSNLNLHQFLIRNFSCQIRLPKQFDTATKRWKKRWNKYYFYRFRHCFKTIKLDFLVPPHGLEPRTY